MRAVSVAHPPAVTPKALAPAPRAQSERLASVAVRRLVILKERKMPLQREAEYSADVKVPVLLKATSHASTLELFQNKNHT
jgi:hypothetical protein